MDTGEIDIDGAIRRVLAGELDAYEHVVRACEAKVRIVLAAMLPYGEPVDDLAQEVFVTAYNKLADYEQGRDFVLWIKEIARNLARNEWRRRSRRRAFRERYKTEVEQTVRPLMDEFLDGLHEHEILSAIRQCIATLGEKSREVFEGYYLHGHPSKVLAAERDRPDRWVRVTLHRGRLAVADCLTKKGILPNAL